MGRLKAIASIAAAILLFACGKSPLEEPARLVRDGRCVEAMPAIERIAARDDRWARDARALLALCLYSTASGREGAALEDWLAVVAALRASIEEAGKGGPGLPGGIGAPDGVMLGDAVLRAMEALAAAGEPSGALEVMEENTDLAVYPVAVTSLSGEARIALRRWAGGAVDLDAAAAVEQAGEERGRLLRLAAGAWHLAGQTEKALVDFARAERVAPLPWKHRERLIEEGQEPEHFLGELIAASVHGVLLADFRRDWESLEPAPRKMNFFVGKRDKDFLEAEEQVETLGHIAASGSSDDGTGGAAGYLYEILVMTALVRAGGGDYAGAIEDIEAAMAVDPDGEDAASDLAILEAISAPFPSS